MANYKAVDADQLDADLSSVANAIRTKVGTTESLAFPSGFVSAVNGLVDSKGIFDATIKEAVIPSSVTKIRRGAFYDCVNLTRVTLHENVTEVGAACFFCCTALQECVLPAGVKTIGEQTFFLNYALQKVDCWLTTISGGSTFSNCTLPVLIIRSDTVCTLANASALSGTRIARETGHIYVPRALVDSYKSATNWSAYASQFRAIEDYPEITGGAA